jgi:gluconate 5-dehydrogenase
MSKLFDLAGRSILVTGASRGIGFAMAETLAQHGARVVLNARDPEALEVKADAIRAQGLKAEIAVFDVTDGDASREAMERIDRDHGRLYGLINNAGVQHRSPVLDFTTADFERVVSINLTSCFTNSREAIRLMLPHGGGRIINTVSMLGPQARPTVPAYIAAKEGLRAMTRALAVEVGSKGILVNAIAPGYIATELNQALLDNKEFSDWVVSKTPAGRWGQPSELGGGAVFLMSEAGAFVNGQILSIDGGMSVQV